MGSKCDFVMFIYLYIYIHCRGNIILYVLKNTFMCCLYLYIMAHIGGRFGQRSHLVKVDFAFSSLKSEVQVALSFWRVALCRPRHLWKCRYCAHVYWNLSYPLLSILKVIFLEINPLQFIETLISFIRGFVYCLYMPSLK